MGLLVTSLSTTLVSSNGVRERERDLKCVGQLSAVPMTIEGWRQTPSFDTFHVYHVAVKSSKLCPSENFLVLGC